MTGTTTALLIHCPRCAFVLAVAEPRRLLLGGTFIYRPVVLHCSHCGARYHWRPTLPTSPP